MQLSKRSGELWVEDWQTGRSASRVGQAPDRRSILLEPGCPRSPNPLSPIPTELAAGKNTIMDQEEGTQQTAPQAKPRNLPRMLPFKLWYKVSIQSLRLPRCSLLRISTTTSRHPLISAFVMDSKSLSRPTGSRNTYIKTCRKSESKYGR